MNSLSLWTGSFRWGGDSYNFGRGYRCFSILTCFSDRSLINWFWEFSLGWDIIFITQAFIHTSINVLFGISPSICHKIHKLPIVGVNRGARFRGVITNFII